MTVCNTLKILKIWEKIFVTEGPRARPDSGDRLSGGRYVKEGRIMYTSALGAGSPMPTRSPQGGYISDLRCIPAFALWSWHHRAPKQHTYVVQSYLTVARLLVRARSTRLIDPIQADPRPFRPL